VVKLLLSLSMQVHEGVNEVWNAGTDVEEVNELVVKVKVENVRHVL
jgi:hypothetical protein